MLLFYHPDFDTHVTLPFFKKISPDLGWGYILFAAIVIVGASNAVNLTDGLDGLAILPTVLVAGALGVFAYASGNVRIADYLLIPYLPGVGELAIADTNGHVNLTERFLR